jgi:hypothetical protein
MALTTRLYLLGVCAALVLCATAVTFPAVPPTIMLGVLGAIFLALASRTHRYVQAQHAGDWNSDGPSVGRERPSSPGDR